MITQRSKRRAHWAAYLWPGLAHLWISGSLAGLALAVAFAFLLNVLVLSTLVWPELLAPRVWTGCALSLSVIWLAALIETRNELRRLAVQSELAGASPVEPGLAVAPELRRTDALLRLAQQSYLRGDWSDAERLIRSILKLDPEDVEAQLLLATVHRRTGRAVDARRRLQRLSTKDDAERWRGEIRRELELLNAAAEPEKTEEPRRQAA